jgi:hypothetical protein
MSDSLFSRRKNRTKSPSESRKWGFPKSRLDQDAMSHRRLERGNGWPRTRIAISSSDHSLARVPKKFVFV